MAIQDVIAASVSNTFGARSASGTAAEGQQQATSVANSIIATVNDKLGLFSGFGDDSLDDAISAIHEAVQHRTQRPDLLEAPAAEAPRQHRVSQRGLLQRPRWMRDEAHTQRSCQNR